MLPDFPKSKRELLELCVLKVRALEARAHPILSEVRSFTQHEGGLLHFQRYDAPPKTQGPVKQTTELDISFDELPDLYGDALDVKLIKLANASGGNKVKLLIERIGEDTRETGQVVNVDGTAPSGSMLLDMLDRVQEDYDETGQSQSKFLIHPSSIGALKQAEQEIENDPELRERAQAIEQRKRREWLDRENRRKLVD